MAKRGGKGKKSMQQSVQQGTQDQEEPNARAKCKDNGMADAKQWVDATLGKGVEKLREEFAEMKRYCPADMDIKLFLKHYDEGRNRYKDVPCQEKHRVVVTWPGINYDFIHANYLPTPNSKKRYICTQGPLDSTIADFWHMVIVENTENVIMLCNVVEKGMAKCAQYWPLAPKESQTYGDVTVTNESVTQFSETIKSICRTVLKISYKKNGKKEEREMRHYQWIDWPDRGVPQVGNAIHDLLSAVRSSKSPIIVHCSAGIGRTGSIVATAFIMERIQNGEPCEDMPTIFKTLRDHRPYSIQNDFQYLFVHRVVLWYFFERYPKFDKTDPRFVKFVKEYDAAVGTQ